MTSDATSDACAGSTFSGTSSGVCESAGRPSSFTPMIVAARIEALNADAVFLAGEFTFLFMLVDKLLKDGENVICACSRRETEEALRADGATEKRSVFVFERL